MKERVYIQDHNSMGAGKWIYDGYYRAWEHLGYETLYFNDWSELFEIDDLENCSLMMTDGFVAVGTPGSSINAPTNEEEYRKVKRVLKEAKSVYMYVSPNSFPKPWGDHPNFVSSCDFDIINYINTCENVHLWSFADMTEELKNKHYYDWKGIHTIPLAFDSVGYKPVEDKQYEFDVCFIGGRADNGFDEKYKIMIQNFSEFRNSGLKCGFFIGKKLTHKQETAILCNSKVAVNIHDAYQRVLGNDTNERTFKSLGLTGVLVSDEVTQASRLFPDVKMSNNPKELVKLVQEYVKMPTDELLEIKNTNKENVANNHTYINRVQKLISL